MAHLETLEPSDVTGSVGEINGGQLEVESVEVVATDDNKIDSPGAVEEHGLGEENMTPLGSGSASLKDNATSESATGTATAPVLSMPHPKKFSHVNINKKFLEKASSATASGPTALASPLARTGSSSRTYLSCLHKGVHDDRSV